MPTTKTYKLPPAFWSDHHDMRACSSTAIVHRSVKSYVVVELDQVAYDDLRSDCEYHIQMSGMGAYDGYMLGVVASARATLKRLDADPMVETTDGHLGLDGLIADQDREFVAPVKRRFRFQNPNPATFPRTISADATSEEQARRIIKADLAHTATWPLITEEA